MTDRRSLSRRKLLWAVTTVGAAASTGSGAAALLQDSMSAPADLAAGTLDLTADPSWGNTDSTSGTSPGAISGNSGRETITLTLSGNPSYVWFRTKCAQCTEAEEKLLVRFGLDTDGDGTVDSWLDGGEYITLRDARERFGEGVRLDGTLSPDATWNLVVEWKVDGMVKTELDVEFDFDFYATQTRHVRNPTRPEAWTDRCDDPCGSTTFDPKEISYVAFCASTDIEEGQISFEFDDGGSTLLLKQAPSSVDHVLLKYGRWLDVFEYDGSTPSSFTVGDGTTYEAKRGEYPGTTTEPPRSNSNPCPGSNWLKYEVDEDRWTSDDGADEGQGTPDGEEKKGWGNPHHGKGGDE